MTAAAKKRAPAPIVPIDARELTNDAGSGGRLTIGEYDLVDMVRITGARSAKMLCRHEVERLDAAERRITRLRDAGIVEGTASSFDVTAAGWAAFQEADRLLLEAS